MYSTRVRHKDIILSRFKRKQKILPQRLKRREERSLKKKN